MDKVDVGIIIGSDSDLEVMKEAAAVLNALGITHEITIVSAHRTPDRMFEYAKTAKGRGLKVIIAGAGGAAHLPGMTASITELPVIGVPIKSRNLKGVDSLYSIVQMPPGIPVATMAINGATNAGLLAARIIGLSNADAARRLAEYNTAMKEQVIRKATKLEETGVDGYEFESSS